MILTESINKQKYMVKTIMRYRLFLTQLTAGTYPCFKGKDTNKKKEKQSMVIKIRCYRRKKRKRHRKPTPLPNCFLCVVLLLFLITKHLLKLSLNGLHIRHVCPVRCQNNQGQAFPPSHSRLLHIRNNGRQYNP